MKWNFLFPDGVALQTFYNLASRQYDLPTRQLPNLNGTDFVPYFLDELKKRYWSQKLCLFLHWAKPEVLPYTKKYLEYKGFNVVYTQDWYSNLNNNGYSELDRLKFNSSKKDYQDTLNILLVAISIVDNPIQELWTLRNKATIKKHNLIVFTVWWLFDFWAAEMQNNSFKNMWTQKRAPKFIRKVKLEWLWRLITDPKRNFKKVKNTLSLFPYILKYLLLKKD
jgi:UDP-N-acetyl-D-mannosaminuronic acid transferase (WecB/TagA/CpsF family)